jgi:signal transduction histidine kinase
MSAKPSTTSPPLSTAAAEQQTSTGSPSGTAQMAPAGGVDASQLIDAVRMLGARGLYGLVWLDEQLVARRRFGTMADFVPLGEVVTDSVTPLMGFDEQIQALITHPDNRLEMPNVAIMSSADEPTSRMNLHIYWIERERQFLLLVSQVLSTGDLEIGLAQQVRKRMMVEAELASKSRELAVANQELTRANRDLAEFAYIISHDLKAPLRAMRYFSDDLELTLDSPADAPGRQDPKVHLASIRAQSRRMAAMLTELLAYSKIGRKVEAIDRIDTRALVERLIRSVPRGPTMQLSVAGEWPVLDTLAAPLDLVLRNLVSNAVLHHDRSSGAIVVSASLQRQSLRIDVTDDGPGIPKAHQEAIFLPFRTLSENQSDDHHGIGLALVRKTIDVVGARLDVISDPPAQRGTTFRVEWPFAILT